jgi:AraC family transcriptional regulator of adaptative response / DNA-3-methyladenine glycosylase II
MQTMNISLNREEFYRAHLARDIRFDGKFFVAVKSTKIYCRPICPARKAQLKNLIFYTYAAQAEEAGYRPCLRCRPETAPGSSDWIGTSDIVRRAVRIMETEELDDLSVNTLADRLSISERWLRELFQREIGVAPLRLLLEKKLSLARNLLDHSGQSITNIAFSSGFNSIRRFNDAFKKRFDQAPSDIRKFKNKSNIQCIHLRYRPPFSWQQMLSYFEFRCLPEIERVTDTSYERLFIHNGIQGWMRASLADNHEIKVEFIVEKNIPILELVSKAKKLFDLDADPLRIETDLASDRALKPLLKNHPGIRIPGCWNNFELAVRAIIGQLISVKAARTILIRLVNLCGRKQTLDSSLALTHYFPSPENILDADISAIGLTKSKEASIKSLARLLIDKELILDGTADYEKTCQKLLSIKGIGPWTVNYIAMRALKNPNAFPETDLEIQKRLKQFNLEPKKWTPWRAYVAILLFSLDLAK